MFLFSLPAPSRTLIRQMLNFIMLIFHDFLSYFYGVLLYQFCIQNTFFYSNLLFTNFPIALSN